jgi:aldehyde:ferredoxin oxidoreductase
MDTISCGATIAFGMQCFEEGLITRQDVGYDLCFGNKESILEMITDIAQKRGLGELLSEGSFRAAEKIGGKAMEFCHHSRKQEVPMHDPRVKTGIGFQYALSSRGADHWVAQHDPFFAELDSPGTKELAGLGLSLPVSKTVLNMSKVRFFHYTNMLCSAYDILGVCTLASVARSVVTLEDIISMVKLSTDWNVTWYELMKAGERANTLARLFNVGAGSGMQSDKLTSVFFRNIQGGPLDGQGAIDETQFQGLVKQYYSMAGWDEGGIPTREKIAELELDDLVDVLSPSTESQKIKK